MCKTVVLLLLLATASVVLYVSQHTEIQANSSPKMYWSEAGAGIIRSANLDGTGIVSVVTGLGNPRDLVIDPDSGKLYWADFGSGKIQRRDLTGGSIDDLVTGLVSVNNLTLDLSAGKIYWTDLGSEKIQRANLDGTGVEDVISTGLRLPAGIAIDPGAGKMIWTEWDPTKIRRADLDGSNVEDLITGFVTDLIPGLALDLSAGKMYWGTAGKIQRANLDGSSVEDVVTNGQVADVTLDLSAGKMYWTDLSGGIVSRSDLDGSNVEDLVIGASSPVGIALDLSPTPTPTPKPPPTPKATPTANPTAIANQSSLSIDADCEDPATDSTIETERTLLVGDTFHICVYGAFPVPGSAAGYQARVHWDEFTLNLNPRTAGTNDLWHLEPPSSGGAPNAASVSQVIGPADDDSGSEAYVRPRAMDDAGENSNPPFVGRVAQLELVCQNHSPGNIEIRVPGADDGSAFLEGTPKIKTEIKPTLASAVIICLDPALDSDRDGCSNSRELDTDETTGGLRNPLNPWDFYDVDKNRQITLFGDILGVIFHYSLDGTPPYDAAYDRGPTAGPNPWNMTAPDGVINLFTDILGVIKQYGHDCT